jgi:hypothetical protein
VVATAFEAPVARGARGARLDLLRRGVGRRAAQRGPFIIDLRFQRAWLSDFILLDFKCRPPPRFGLASAGLSRQVHFDTFGGTEAPASAS